MTSTKLFNKLMNDLPDYLEFEETKSGFIRAKFYGYTLFLYINDTKFSIHYRDSHDPYMTWKHTSCSTYEEFKRALPKMFDTIIELKHPNYQHRLDKLNEDF